MIKIQSCPVPSELIMGSAYLKMTFWHRSPPFKKTTPPVNNPLQNPLILLKIFDLLESNCDISQLLLFRLVCSLWNSELSKKFKLRSKLHLKLKHHSQLQWILHKQPKLFLNKVSLKLSRPHPLTLQLLPKIFPILSLSVAHLLLVVDLEFFPLLLTSSHLGSLKCLKSLSIVRVNPTAFSAPLRSHPFFSYSQLDNLTRLSIRNAGCYVGAFEIKSLLKIAPNLTHFEASGRSVGSLLKELITCGGIHKRLESLKVLGSRGLGDDEIKMLAAKKFPKLKHLVLSADVNVASEVLTTFVAKSLPKDVQISINKV